MQSKKYGVTHAIKICFHYAPSASLIKLCIEVISGAFMPLMVLIVASFINNAVSFANGVGQIAPLIITLTLMAAYYAYLQVSQIIIRISEKALENALRENLRPQLVQKQAGIPYAFFEDPETLDLVSRVCDNSEKKYCGYVEYGHKNYPA